MGYDPTIGVWFERDPAQVGTNLNEYVGGAPTGFVDPAGMDRVPTSQPGPIPATTQPTSQPTTKPKSKNTDEPTTKIWVLPRDIDLIALAADDLTSEFKDKCKLYAKKNNAKVVTVLTVGMLIEAIKSRSKELAINDNCNNVEKYRKIKVLVISHNRPADPMDDISTVMIGKESIVNSEVRSLSCGITTQEAKNKLSAKFRLSEFYQVKECVREIIFAGCALAKTVDEQNFLDVMAQELNAKIWAGKTLINTGVRGIYNEWITVGPDLPMNYKSWSEWMYVATGTDINMPQNGRK